eukprot:m.53347 g.53347  ORF g.53347 m.53347 type:complete len:651 (+) comp9151_c0_seq1:128-2080(+)
MKDGPWAVMMFTGAPTAEELLGVPTLAPRKRRRVLPVLTIPANELATEVEAAEAEATQWQALAALDAARSLPRHCVMRSQLTGATKTEGSGSVSDFPSSEASGTNTPLPHIRVASGVTSSDSVSAPVTVSGTAEASSESIPLPLDTASQFSAQTRWRGATQSVTPSLGLPPPYRQPESPSVQDDHIAPELELPSKAAIDWDSWSPRGSTAVKACATMRDGCEVRCVTAVVLQVHPVQTVGPRSSTLRTIHIGDPSRQNFEVTVWGVAAPKWILGDVVSISRLQIKEFRGRLYGSVFSAERIRTQVEADCASSDADRKRDISELKMWRRDCYPWLEPGGESRVAYASMTNLVEGFVVHTRGLVAIPPRQIDSVQWCFEVTEGRVQVTVIVFGSFDEYRQMERSLQPGKTPSGGIGVNLQNFYVTRKEESSDLQLVTIDGESVITVEGHHVPTLLPSVAAAEVKGDGNFVVGKVKIQRILFSNPPLQASRPESNCGLEVMWTRGGSKLETSSEDALCQQLYSGCISCASEPPTVDGIVQICQRRGCSLGSGRVFHRRCIRPVSVEVEDSSGKNVLLPVQYGTGPSHRTLDFFCGGGTDVLTDSEISARIHSRCVELLHERSDVNLKVSVCRGKCAPDTPSSARTVLDSILYT